MKKFREDNELQNIQSDWKWKKSLYFWIWTMTLEQNRSLILLNIWQILTKTGIGWTMRIMKGGIKLFIESWKDFRSLIMIQFTIMKLSDTDKIKIILEHQIPDSYLAHYLKDLSVRGTLLSVNRQHRNVIIFNCTNYLNNAIYVNIIL